MVYAGGDNSCPKVGEYGGNSFGYGGRSVVKTGWPKDIVKVHALCLTLFYSMITLSEPRKLRL